MWQIQILYCINDLQPTTNKKHKPDFQVTKNTQYLTIRDMLQVVDWSKNDSGIIIKSSLYYVSYNKLYIDIHSVHRNMQNIQIYLQLRA